MKKKSEKHTLWTSLGRRGPLNMQHRPMVTIREMAFWHPGSVYESLLGRANWIGRLNISSQAKRLSRLNGREFRVAAEAILKERNSYAT